MSHLAIEIRHNRRSCHACCPRTNAASTTAPRPGTNTASSTPASWTRSSVDGHYTRSESASTAIKSWSVWPRPGWLTETVQSPRSLTAELRHAQRSDARVHLAPCRRRSATRRRAGGRCVSHRHPDLRRAIDFGCLECRGAENVVEVVVRQHDMADCAASHGMHVSGDRPRLWQHRTTVDQHGSVPIADQAHGDVEKRKTATEHAVGRPFPAEAHCPSVSGCAVRYCSITCGVRSAV